MGVSLTDDFPPSIKCAGCPHSFSVEKYFELKFKFVNKKINKMYFFHKTVRKTTYVKIRSPIFYDDLKKEC